MGSIKNLAIIMDGNGRWAQEKGKPRVWGHVRGSFKVSPIVEKAREMGLNSLTLYAFSTENWSRPETEVRTLFRLFSKFIKSETKRIVSNGIRFQLVGEKKNIPHDLLTLIEELEFNTRYLTSMKLNLAFNYGGRSEILHAVNKWIGANPGKYIDDESALTSGTYCPEVAEIDLIIRTGGDQRISNFLIWQAAYAELFFTPIPWPEFQTEHLQSIVEHVEKRERRFGMTHSMESLGSVQYKVIENIKKLGQSSLEKDRG